MNKLTSQLRAMGVGEDAIATATVGGKPVSEIDKPKASRVDGMNKAEAQYSFELDILKAAGEIIDWWYEAVNLKLAKKTWYKPDFLVLLPNGKLRFVEIKGFLRDDAAIKYKLAREEFAFAEWVMLRLVKRRWVEVPI